MMLLTQFNRGMLATFDVYVGRGEVNVGYEITTIDIWNRRGGES